MDTLSSKQNQSWLGWFLKGFVFFGMLILVGRLVELQIIKGAYYQDLSDNNRIRRIAIQAPRGNIYSSSGELIVGNKEIKKTIIFTENGFEKSLNIEGASDDEIIIEYERHYLLKDAAAHLTGYLGEANQYEVGNYIDNCKNKGLIKLSDMVGRGGLEQVYDCILRGTDGEELIEVDASGKKVRSLGRKYPIKGEDVKTNIDLSLQIKLKEIIDENSQKLKFSKAAVIVSDTEGRIYGLYSTPSFNPNVFIEGKNNDITNILEDKNMPMLNRVIGGLYHPGSVFKPVVVAAAINENSIDDDFKFVDEGQIVVESAYGKYFYKNWYFTQYGGTEGEIDVQRAIARSTDTFFYKIGELTGVDNIVEYSQKFGLSQKYGIDLTGEVAGLVPSPKWKLKEKGERWYLGNTYHFSIGQGDLAVTPLSVNMETQIIASEGKLCDPRVLGNGECRDLGIKNEVFEIIKKGMLSACSSGGTGYTFFDFKDKYGIDVACKTGTAEVNDIDGKTHAWFTLFAPYKDTNVILTVMVEEGGEGSKTAGPIAREIMDFLYKGQSL